MIYDDLLTKRLKKKHKNKRMSCLDKFKQSFLIERKIGFILTPTRKTSFTNY